jgi:Uma2 family endonuclease
MTVTTTGKRRLLQNQPHRWTRQEYEKMAEIGLFSPDTRLELVEGEILEMAAHTSHHAAAIALAQHRLSALNQAGFHLRVQLPLALSDDSEPEPDLAVVIGSPEDYWEEHPRSAVLIIEVAYSSLSYDQERKRQLYARCYISEYWILNLSEHRLEVYREPEQGDYQTRMILTAGETISPLISADLVIEVAGLLPRTSV